MRAFRNIRDEMREAIIVATNPYAPARGAPIRKEREAPDEDEGNIEPWMAEAFKELLRAKETGAPFALISCFVNGQPTAVIALLRKEGTQMQVTPLFMAVMPGMSFSERPPDTPDPDDD